MQDSARHFVRDLVEDETEGNAKNESLEDFASAELVAASVLCAQPKRVFHKFISINFIFNIYMHIM